MESQPQIPKFRNNPGNLHPWIKGLVTPSFTSQLGTNKKKMKNGNFSRQLFSLDVAGLAL